MKMNDLQRLESGKTKEGKDYSVCSYRSNTGTLYYSVIVGQKKSRQDFDFNETEYAEWRNANLEGSK